MKKLNSALRAISYNRAHMFVGFCGAMAAYVLAYVLTPLLVLLVQVATAFVLALFTIFILWSLKEEHKQNGEIDLLNFFGFQEDKKKTLPNPKKEVTDVSSGE